MLTPTPASQTPDPGSPVTNHDHCITTATQPMSLLIQIIEPIFIPLAVAWLIACAIALAVFLRAD